jgi:hypothetical protein
MARCTASTLRSRITSSRISAARLKELSLMSKLIYITNTSLDGYVEDATGAFDWVNPEQAFEFSGSCCGRSGPISMGGDSMRRWPIGMRRWRLSNRTPRLRPGLAEGPESRLFANADRRYDAQHACRAGLRPRGYSKAQTGIGARYQHWRRRACGACARSRSRRRMSPLCQPRNRRRRKAGIPSRLTTESRTP